MKKKLKLIAIIVLLCALIPVVIFSVKGIKKNNEKKREEERLAQLPYFTEFKLSMHEATYMTKGFYCYFEQSKEGYAWYQGIDKSKWPDYSFYTMKPTEKTEKAVVVLNYYLFDEIKEYDHEGRERAKEMGFTAENRLTVYWVMSHPKEAVDIMDSMSNEGDWFLTYGHIKSAYDEIQSIDSQSQAE